MEKIIPTNDLIIVLCISVAFAFLMAGIAYGQFQTRAVRRTVEPTRQNEDNSRP